MAEEFDFQPIQSKRRKRRNVNRIVDSKTLSLEEQLERLEATLKLRKELLSSCPEYLAEWNAQLERVKSIVYSGCAEDAVKGNSATRQHEESYSAETGEKSSGRPKNDHSVHIVCLGIGKISESRESQFQFLQLQSIASDFIATDIAVYDPMFTPLDLELLKKAGYRVFPHNQLGMHEMPQDHPMIAYLPHCPRDLYERFLYANRNLGFGWSDEDSKDSGRHVLLANDFKDYAISLPAKSFEAKNPLLAKAANLFESIKLPSLPNNNPAHNAYSSLAWHHLPVDSASALVTDDIAVPHVQSDGPGELISDEIGKFGVTDDNDLIERMKGVSLGGEVN